MAALTEFKESELEDSKRESKLSYLPNLPTNITDILSEISLGNSPVGWFETFEKLDDESLEKILNGVEENEEKGIKYYLDADTKYSHHNLGNYHRLNRNFDQAIFHFEKANELGYTNSIGDLVEIYLEKKDLKEAREWSKVGTEAGNIKCIFMLSHIEKIVYKNHEYSKKLYELGRKLLIESHDLDAAKYMMVYFEDYPFKSLELSILYHHLTTTEYINNVLPMQRADIESELKESIIDLIKRNVKLEIENTNLRIRGGIDRESISLMKDLVKYGLDFDALVDYE